VIVSINQPAYLPWLGYFHRIAVSDVHVVLDQVQFEKNSFVNRNKVRTSQGSTWVTVPVRTSGRFGALPINEVEIDNTTSWARKHWTTMQQAYSRAPAFDDFAPWLGDLYTRPWERLADLSAEITGHVLRQLDIGTPIVTGSELAVEGKKDELVLSICRELGATTYLSGPLGRTYLREDNFADAGIDVVYHDYQHPLYPQLHGAFLPSMAVIDLLFNCGALSRELLMRDQQEVVAR
jgi:hypothetical protein